MTPEQLFAAVEDRPGAVWLDSGDASSGWSIVAWDPVEQVTDGARWPERGRTLTRADRGGSGGPFAGGVIGYLAYEAGHRVAPVPAGRPTPEPEVLLQRFDGAACYRHADRSWHLTGPPALQRDLARQLAAAPRLEPPPPPSGRALPVDPTRWERSLRQIHDWILAGDCYQVNLTRAVRVEGAGSPFAAYRRLRQRTAPYGAFLRVADDLAILSNSPELLLEVRGDRLRSTPIKGTRPRSPDPTRDDALSSELLASVKDRAELTMIVDLVRNDLGRVAAIGSVHAGERELERLPTVFHTVWPVTAQLAAGHDRWDALAALFPPGSVTGAPKIRACQRIRELEAEPRGVYCGAIGYAADNGDACWSVAIRVAVFSGAAARYHVGGGIVIDSRPGEEWQETVDKEAALRRALVEGSG